MAFYFLLALFPALLFLVALIGLLPGTHALSELLAVLGVVAPQEFVHLLREQLAQISGDDPTGLVTLGILGAVWSSSAAMAATIDALNRAFDVTEWRPWWKRRLVAIALTVVLALLVIAALVLVIVGPAFALRLAGSIGLGPAAARLWSVLRWPVMIGCLVVALNLVYYFAPNRFRRWTWMTPGSLLATALWIACSFLFKFYVTYFRDYAATYGVIAGAIVAMLWFYVGSLVLLIGAELDGVLDRD
jgi:membrane protein